MPGPVKTDIYKAREGEKSNKADSLVESVGITAQTAGKRIVKAIGKGMAFPMDEVCFSLGDPEETICRGCFSNREGLYYMRDFGKFVLAVCVLTDIRGELCT